MGDRLSGRRVAILAADGVEQVELVEPRRAVEEAGGQAELVSTHSGEIQAMNKDINPADRFPVDREVSQVSPDDYDALILPGGTVNPDNLRNNPDAVEFVRGFVNSSKDRKSTRLNSSHVKISYAVFCLKKKKKTKTQTHAN